MSNEQSEQSEQSEQRLHVYHYRALKSESDDSISQSLTLRFMNQPSELPAIDGYEWVMIGAETLKEETLGPKFYTETESYHLLHSYFNVPCRDKKCRIHSMYLDFSWNTINASWTYKHRLNNYSSLRVDPTWADDIERYNDYLKNFPDYDSYAKGLKSNPPVGSEDRASEVNEN